MIQELYRAAQLPDFHIERTAAALGLDVERRQLLYRDVDAYVRQNRNVLFQTPAGWLVDASRLFAEEKQELAESLQPVLAGLADASRQKALAALTADHLSRRSVMAYRVRPAVTSPWRELARRSGWTSLLVQFLGVEALRLAAWVWAWKSLFSDDGAAWVPALLAVVPLHLASLWVQGKLAISFSRTLKQRMLARVLRLDPEAMAAEGSTAILGTVNESATLESLALSGGFQSLAGALELAVAAWFLPPVLLGAAAAWVVLAAWLAWRFYQATRLWTRDRLQMTDGLVERLLGHRTRLAQESPADWHLAEDRELAAYEITSRRRDHAEAWLTGAVADGWLALGLLVAGVMGVAALPVLGGILLAHGAWKALAAGAWQISLAAAGFERVQALLSKPEAQDPVGCVESEGPVEVQHVSFAHRDAPEALFRDCSVTLPVGSRVVLEGDSGSGKSTFAALVAGVREPSAGRILVGGQDRAALGADGWRRAVALAPQFHQNHVFTGPLAFNLLLGAREPWGDDVVGKSYVVAKELGLRPLVERMPAGMMQVLGETGWQLSQGERSRLFIARTLLQGAPLVILDESLAALDPKTFEQVVQCLEKHAQSLLVVAHR